MGLDYLGVNVSRRFECHVGVNAGDGRRYNVNVSYQVGDGVLLGANFDDPFKWCFVNSSWASGPFRRFLYVECFSTSEGLFRDLLTREGERSFLDFLLHRVRLRFASFSLFRVSPYGYRCVAVSRSAGAAR